MPSLVLLGRGRFLEWVFFLPLLLRRAVAVELEVTRELNKLLCSVESAYLSIVRGVVEYAVVNKVTSATQLQRIFYRKYRLEYPGLHSFLNEFSYLWVVSDLLMLLGGCDYL
jgi:hypothetical protein